MTYTDGTCSRNERRDIAFVDAACPSLLAEKWVSASAYTLTRSKSLTVAAAEKVSTV